MELSLEPFDEAYARTVLGWVRSPAELDAWASVAESEPSLALFRKWHADPDVHPFLLFAEGRLCGYGEVWEDRAEEEAELARILVAPDERGRGIGRRFVGLLAQRSTVASTRSGCASFLRTRLRLPATGEQAS